MKETIQTTRFGAIDIGDEHLIEFRDGMIGFPHLKHYVLIESSSMPILLWLQSTENPAVAFPVIEPWFFRQDYRPSPNDAEKVSLKLEAGDRTKLFTVMTIPSEMTRMTVNMKAPVLINLDRGTAVQLVLADKQYEVRVPAHEAFSKAVASYSLNEPVDRDIPKASQASDQESWAAVKFKEAGQGASPAPGHA